MRTTLRAWVQAKYARQSDPIVFAAPTPEDKVETGRQLRDEQVKAFAYTGYVFGQEMR